MCIRDRAGGVSANLRLRQKFENKLKEKNLDIKFLTPLLEYTTDNAIMVALASFFQYVYGPKKTWDWKKIEAMANLRL